MQVNATTVTMRYGNSVTLCPKAAKMPENSRYKRDTTLWVSRCNAFGMARIATNQSIGQSMGPSPWVCLEGASSRPISIFENFLESIL